MLSKQKRNPSLSGALVALALSVCVPSLASAQEHGSTGEEVFMNTCNKCHDVISQESAWIDFLTGDSSSVQLAVITPRGPTLNGIVNRPVAIIEGYPYSKAMRAFGETGAIWDRETLDLYLTNSRALVKGFMVLRLGEADRQLVLDYLTSVALYQE